MNTYRVVFRNSTVVDDKIIDAKTMAKAAKKAAKITRQPDSLYAGWSVYSITLI